MWQCCTLAAVDVHGNGLIFEGKWGLDTNGLVRKKLCIWCVGMCIQALTAGAKGTMTTCGCKEKRQVSGKEK